MAGIRKIASGINGGKLILCFDVNKYISFFGCCHLRSNKDLFKAYGVLRILSYNSNFIL